MADKPNETGKSNPPDRTDKQREGTARRTFLGQVAAATAAGAVTSGDAFATAQAPVATQAATTAPAPQQVSARLAVTFPRRFAGEALRTIAFPLGGIGTGSVSLGGRGHLRDWEIFNRPDKGNSPRYAFPAIRVRVGDQTVTRILESRLLPPYEGSSGLGANNVPGLPRLQDATFTGEFPFASIDFSDDKLPVDVSLDAFSPFVPLDDEVSGLPVAVLRYRVRNRASAAAEVSVAYSIENPVGREGRQNTYREEGGLRGLSMTNPFADAGDPLKGSFVLAVAGDPGELTQLTGWRGGGWWVGPLTFWDDFKEDGRLDQARHILPQPIGSLCARKSLDAGGEATFTFLLAWHFPNRTPERCGWGNQAPEEMKKAAIGNYYCRQFADAWAAASHVAKNLAQLESASREFVDAMKRTSLPPAVLDAAMSNLSTLRTNTCFRTADGHFHVFEGCNDHSGCCFGSCTHVWNYESALAFLFPKLSRSLRDYQFGWTVDERGLQDFRYFLPPEQKQWGKAAADGQMGTLMKLYLDWKLSGDDAWLRQRWPAAKRALEFAWVEGGWDEDRDGVMEGCQHNTYDIEFYGPNPLSGIWYLGALRAGEEMARAAGDTASASEYRRLFNNGSRWIDEHLFNGEYYVQQLQPMQRERIAEGLIVGMGATDSQRPEFQMGEGCLADQVLGQYFARIAGLGDLIDSAKAHAALASIHRYNFKTDLSQHESVERIYAVNDDAGLVICDYGKQPRPPIPFPYEAEVWTGIEYQVAAHMFFEGLYDEGLQIVEAARQRHDGVRRNPWNEPECGHHYARALASWSCVLALSGFEYAAPSHAISVREVGKGSAHTGFWSVPGAWGTVERRATTQGVDIRIEVVRGELRADSLATAAASARNVTVTLGDSEVTATLEIGGGQATGRFGTSAQVRPGTPLHVRFA